MFIMTTITPDPADNPAIKRSKLITLICLIIVIILVLASFYFFGIGEFNKSLYEIRSHY